MKIVCVFFLHCLPSKLLEYFNLGVSTDFGQLNSDNKGQEVVSDSTDIALLCVGWLSYDSRQISLTMSNIFKDQRSFSTSDNYLKHSGGMVKVTDKVYELRQR